MNELTEGDVVCVVKDTTYYSGERGAVRVHAGQVVWPECEACDDVHPAIKLLCHLGWVRIDDDRVFVDRNEIPSEAVPCRHPTCQAALSA